MSNLSIVEKFDLDRVDARLRDFLIDLSFHLKAEAHFPGALQGLFGFRVYEGFRSKERQDFLYEQGRSRPGPIVTKAKGGQSAHNYGLAVDLCNINLELKKNLIEEVLLRHPEIEWGAHWKNFPDPPHFQIRNWKKEVSERIGKSS